MIPRGRERDETFGAVHGEIASSTVALYFARKVNGPEPRSIFKRIWWPRRARKDKT